MTMTLESEREGFEAWVQTTSGWKACKARNKPMYLRQNADGSYNDFRVNDRWLAWKARAHLTQPAQSVDDAVVASFIYRAASVVCRKSFPSGPALVKAREIAELALTMLSAPPIDAPDSKR